MSTFTTTTTFTNGVEIPTLGLGTWQVPDGPATYDAVAEALRVGYRHIDTARAYGNEASVARAIADSGLAPEDVFVTTKIPAQLKTYDEAVESIRLSLDKLGRIDLMLIHAPWPWDAIGSDHTAGNAEVWRAMEEAYARGELRAIGVSNFEVSHLAALLETATVVPHANQVRYFPGHAQAETSAFCAEHGIVVEAYSPLATGALLGSSELATVAERYGRTVAQLSIRYVLQKGAVALPKTTTPSRMVENADVDFEISAEDMAYLDGLADPTA